MSKLQYFHSQFIDLGLEKPTLETYLKKSGYWGDDAARARYGYVLSPSAYVVSREQEIELQRLARATFGAVSHLNEELCAIAAKKSPSSHDEARLLKLANNASRSLLRPLDGETKIPPVMKIDLVQNADGGYGIAEIDTYNPRGLGYVALLEHSLPKRYRERRFPGLAGLGRKLDYAYGEGIWFVIVSDFERFYESAFRIFADAMRQHCTDVRIVRASECTDENIALMRAFGLLVIPDTLDAHPELREKLMAEYRASRKLRTFFPPVAYLGSKAFLPYLRAQPGMEEFIPPTYLVGKKCGWNEALYDRSKPQVLKAAVSSGLKKVLFSDLDPEFDATLQSVADQRNPSWILQEQVKQEPVSVIVFDENGERVMLDYYLRVTAYIAENGIIDVEITGRPDRKVHGAPDCIMLPCILA